MFVSKSIAYPQFIMLVKQMLVDHDVRIDYYHALPVIYEICTANDFVIGNNPPDAVEKLLSEKAEEIVNMVRFNAL